MATGLQTWAEIVKDVEKVEADGGGGDFGPIPAETYDFEVTKAEAKVSQSGNRMWNLTCTIKAGPYRGRIVWHNVVLSAANPKALPIFFRQMDAVGVTKEYLLQNPSDEQIASKIQGASFRGNVIQETWEDKTRARIKVMRPIAGGVPGGAPSPIGAPPTIVSSAPKAAAPDEPPF
jgi:hypothetical protein